MTPIARPYAGDTDRRRLYDFIVACRAAPRHMNYWHVGDLIWGLYQNTVFDPARNIRLWSAPDGSLLGFAWFEPPRALGMQLHPSVVDDLQIGAAMLAWAAGRRDEDCAPPPAERRLVASAFADDGARIALLTQQGFAGSAQALVHMRRDLPIVPPLPPPPAGFVVRPVAGDDEFAARVALHREVWHPSRVTLAAYRRLRMVPGYRPDLDLIAVAPDGRLAAYCIAWLDAANRLGEFEPVGTHPAFRGQGLAQAVVHEGCRRLHAAGAQAVMLLTSESNTAARHLYARLGFVEQQREIYYVEHGA
ncbi:MAG TPA: GNAT family N-acetyltransferase [Chloroflexia bacterium]|nr:GNAT family N-acetyltransferase [Chloroflexia bacterium]